MWRSPPPACERHAQSRMLLRQLVEIFYERHHGAIESLYFRVRRFDDVIFVRRMCARTVTETEMSGGKFRGIAGKDVTWIRTGIARPEQWIDSEFLVSRNLRLYERRISRCARRIVTARHVHFNVAKA